MFYPALIKSKNYFNKVPREGIIQMLHGEPPALARCGIYPNKNFSTKIKFINNQSVAMKNSNMFLCFFITRPYIKQEFLSSQEAVDRIFKYGGSAEELREQRENRSEAKEKLDDYSNEVCAYYYPS